MNGRMNVQRCSEMIEHLHLAAQLESGVENGGGYLQMSMKREGRAERIARERGRWKW